MTRKGLAFGAGAALLATSLVTAPAAVAAEDLTLAPSAGTTYSTIHTSSFTLETGFPANVAAGSYKFLKYRVQNAGLASVSSLMTGSGSKGAANTVEAFNYGLASFATGGGDKDAAGVTDSDFVVAVDNNAGAPAAAQGNLAQLHLNSADLTAAGFSVVVTAWLDTDNDNTIDAGESTSPSRTVTFVDLADVTGSVSILAPVVADASLKANVTLSNSINVQQIDDGDIAVEFGTTAAATAITSYNDRTGGADVDGGGGGDGNPDAASVLQNTVALAVSADAIANPNAVAWNAVDSVLQASFTPVDTVAELANAAVANTALAVAAATKYTATLKFINDAENAYVTEGTASTSTSAAAATNYSVKWNVKNSADAKTTAIGYEDAGATAATGYTDNQASTALVRNTATTSAGATVEIFVGTDVAVPVGIEDVPVVVTVASANLELDDAITVEGKTLFTGQSRTFTLTTDATGKTSFAISAGKADAAESITYNFTVNGVAPGAGDPEGTITYQAADYSIYALNDWSGTNSISIDSGDTYSVDYQVVDQWGTAPADNVLRVVAFDTAASNAERTTAADFAYNVPVVGGKATVNVVDNGVGTGSYTMTAGHALLDGAVGVGAGDTVVTTVKVVADADASTITLTKLAYGTAQANDANADGDFADAGDTDNTSKLILETKTMYQYFANLAPATLVAPTLTANQQVTVGGTVKNAAGVAVPHATVTLQAAGFLFKTGSNYALDTITLRASATGVFSVDVYSSVGGAQTIRMTAGAATASQALTYAAAVSGAAKSFTLTTPAASEPGRTVDVTVKVVDKFGNGVQGATVTLSSTGPGYLINTSGTSLKDGTYSTKLLLGSNDAGTAVVKAAMTIAGEEVVKTSSINVGVGAVAASDQKVNAGSFKGYVALYAKGYAGKRMSAKVGKDWVVVESLASNFERVVEFTGAGYTVAVRIYIDRVLIDTITVTTK